jgi:hypothetical protein
MIYPELLRTEIEEGFLKMVLTEGLKDPESVAKALEDFEKIHLKDLIHATKAFVSSPQEDIETQFLSLKKRILEHKAWIDLFINLISEIHPKLYEMVQKRKDKVVEILDRLLNKIVPFESQVLKLRKQRLRKNLDQEIELASAKIATLIKNARKGLNAEQELLLSKVLKDQEALFKNIANLLHTQFEKWEKLILKNGRGFIFSDPQRIPFSALYTLKGDFYIILEVMGHLLGYGLGKSACRSVHLQSSQIFALIKSRTEYPEIKDRRELQEKIEKNFLLTWRESETLNCLHGQLGILQIRERLAFRFQSTKQLYLIEDYFADGDLSKFLIHILGKNTHPPSFKELFQMCFQLLTALKAIHNQGFIHFDIKPENILIDRHTYLHWIVSLADFNTSKPYSETLSFAQIGHSTKWCPPEYAIYHLNKEKDPTPQPIGPLLFRFDVWSLGCVLYCLCFHEALPWEGLTEEQTYQMIAQLPKEWIPARFRKHLYYPLLKHMLQIHPQERITSAQALEQFMALSQTHA